MAKLYDLTRFTGRRKNAQRRTVVMTVETNYRDLYTAGVGAVVGLAVTGILMPFVGVWSLASFAVTIPIAYAVVSRRTSGLQVSNLQALNDRMAAKRGWTLFRRAPGVIRKTGIVILAGEPLKPAAIVDCIPNMIDNPDVPESHATIHDRLSGTTPAPTPKPEPEVPVHALGRPRSTETP